MVFTVKNFSSLWLKGWSYSEMKLDMLGNSIQSTGCVSGGGCCDRLSISQPDWPW